MVDRSALLAIETRIENAKQRVDEIFSDDHIGYQDLDDLDVADDLDEIYRELEAMHQHVVKRIESLDS